MTKPEQKRCAIYTRKSSEEGLEQDFNSLQAQREACEAYISSQRGEGWKLIPDAYDDGGISGGTMDRPALRSLLAAIQNGQIDVIVVYKVDRLTRSLADFAKMVEIFDRHRVSFVAVTQQFNTTTSMGRLTLNVLLSFAQFEREVTGERIRDKIAASKRKGMWMGGVVPLGYRAENRKLIVDHLEAAAVRDIYQRYLRCSGVAELSQELKQAGIRRKVKPGMSPAGHSTGSLYHLLSNPVYIGIVAHKDQQYPGQHEALMDRPMWDAVQAKLATGAVRTTGERKTDRSVLLGKIFDEQGIVLTPSHAVKGARRYRYYVSRSGEEGANRRNWRLPASEIEKRVRNVVEQTLRDQGQVVNAALKSGLAESDLPRLLSFVQHPVELLSWVTEVHLAPAALKISLTVPYETPITIETTTAMQLRRRGVEQRLVVPAADQNNAVDPVLAKTLGRAFKWWELLRTGKANSISAVAKREGLPPRYIADLLPLAFLAPRIIETIQKGQQPAHITAQHLIRHIKLPYCWQLQKQALQFP